MVSSNYIKPGCSISSAQIEPNAGKWKTWVLDSGDQLRLPAPPDEAATRTEIAQLKDIAKQRDAATLNRFRPPRGFVDGADDRGI